MQKIISLFKKWLSFENGIEKNYSICKSENELLKVKFVLVLIALKEY